MRSVVQRVKEARVRVVEGKESYISGEISQGLMVLIGITHGDSSKDAQYIAGKIAGLRIFEDEEEKMNLSVMEKSARILLVSQFTLLGSVIKGKRPSFTNAAPPELAEILYEEVAKNLEALGCHVERGVFRSHMEVELINDGPVTILIDSQKQF